jgi:L-amino acid N-acyltransferase
MLDVKVRLATVEDAEALRQIYNVAVTTSVVTFDLVPRSLQDQREWIEARSGAHAVVVAEEGGRIAGYASLSPYRDKPAYATSVEDSVYVHEEWQGQGVGKLLLSELVDVASAHGFHAMFARIVDGHGASIRLHEALGFEHVGIEREVGRKFGRWLDVVVMQRLL